MSNMKYLNQYYFNIKNYKYIWTKNEILRPDAEKFFFNLIIIKRLAIIMKEIIGNLIQYPMS